MTRGRTEPSPILQLVSSASVGAPLVLFLPGLSGNTSQWDLVLPKLAESHVAVAYGAPILPNPAFGDSRPTVTGLAKLLAEEIEKIGCPSVIVVAHSVGAFVALALCRLLPQVVVSVVIINGGLATVGRFLDRPAAEMLRNPKTCLNALRLFALAGSPAPDRLKRAVLSHPRLGRMLLGSLVGEQTLASEEQRASIAESAGSFDVLRALWDNRHHWPELQSYAGTISTRVVFVVGDQDPMSSEADTRVMASLLSNAEVLVSHGAGHLAPVETANVVAQLVLQSVPSGS